MVYIVEGKRIGRIAKLLSIKEEGLLRKKKIAHLTVDKLEWEVPLKHTFVIGKAKAEIKIE